LRQHSDCNRPLGAKRATPIIILIMAIATVNPATGEIVKTFEALTAAQIEPKLQLAAKAFQSHRHTTFADRAAKMMRAAEILEQEKEEYGRLMTLEMGKPLKAAVAEAAKCATGCRYYAENAERFLADEVIETSAKRSFVRYFPMGAVLAIMPWNFPFWQVFRFAAPALMAGNVGLLKHASNVPQCALKIERYSSARVLQKAYFRRCWSGRGRSRAFSATRELRRRL
jgi:succinate-semialdehyde dehydrogenase/glutarate-semialdehyde dehydrogenase